jgi:hypothetical protein
MSLSGSVGPRIVKPMGSIESIVISLNGKHNHKVLKVDSIILHSDNRMMGFIMGK